MFVSDILSGLVITFVTVFSWLNLLQVWHIYITSLIFGFVEAFFFPAYQAVIPQITPPDMLTSANSLNGLSQRVTGIVGPALGAALVATGGTSITFGLNALSFFISALFVFPLLKMNIGINRQDPNKAAISDESRTFKDMLKQGLADLREGWDAIISVPWIWITIVIFGFLNIMEAGPRAVAMPFFIKNDLGADVGLLGIFGSSFSIGYVLGMLWLGQYKRLRWRGRVSYIAIAINGVMLLLFGLNFPIPNLIGSMFVYGVCMSIFSLIWTNTLQEMVPHELLGRVYSIDALGSWVLLPVGFAIAGWATDLFGAPTVFLIGGLGTIGLTLVGLSHPAIRNLD
jgi:MFS family permease